MGRQDRRFGEINPFSQGKKNKKASSARRRLLLALKNQIGQRG
jgi:hypothetical protein